MRGLDGPWGLRVAGLVGVAVVAAGAYGAGALPGRDPGAGLRGAGSPDAGYWWGLAAWVVGLTILSGAWWRLGNRLAQVSSRWLIVTGALWAVPLLFAPPLASRDVYSYACQGEIWRAGLDPYAVGAADGGCPWAYAVPNLWQHTPAPYGPVGIALSGAAATVGRAVGGPADHQLLAAVSLLRVVALIGGVLIAAYAGRLATAAGVDAGAARWLGLLSPLVAVHLVSGAHNDAITAGLVVAALAVAVPAAGRRGASVAQAAGGDHSPLRRAGAGIAAGAFLGLAVGVKVTALIALPFVVLLVAGQQLRRSEHGWRNIAGSAAVVTGTAASVFAAASLATGLDLGWIGALSDTGSLIQWTSLPTGIGMAFGYLFRAAGWPGAVDPAIDIARICGVAALAAIGLALCWRALRATLGRPSQADAHDHGADGTRKVIAACGWALAAATILLPVFYPWYALAPLAVLACATPPGRTRTGLAIAALAITALVLPNGLGLAVLTKLPGAILDVVIVVALAYRFRGRLSLDKPAQT
ncbi:polyprenol phosphomannose-dependent alpha 1,6 mannosyltransferase MptB [Asanoa sp. WMMD1127]|uniref:polyprenol phosphomannose-dependent alpha 1,6 mannosyltransferase MptB n=1 Tax=Asanoa sp. WMMD1127 TaxID=3016107 RepID=UPI002417EA4D|nr:polyprenol phosphomannose-dependent alpha 1,6 mannosyltransferase MptB [Asanoa sp. WMMD1127]MDG4827115.1 polyprenol phosphomannose-dependent alpha 1,6 mannosyltransferase MptB [Asanoa sp. WMMD1127]